MAGDAPADKRVLAIRSIETKLVMHCMSGDWSRSLERRVQALTAHEFWSCSLLRLSGSMSFFYASFSLCVKKVCIFLGGFLFVLEVSLLLLVMVFPDGRRDREGVASERVRVLKYTCAVAVLPQIGWGVYFLSDKVQIILKE